jgi:thioredoxin 1
MAAVFDTPIHTSAQNLDRVLKTERPMVIAFATPDCEPCRSLEPTLREIAKEFAGRALVVLVDDSREGSLETRFRLTRVPTLVYWREGKEVARVEGAVDIGTVRNYTTFLLETGSRPNPASGPSIPLSGAPAASTATGPSTTPRPSPGPSGTYPGGTTTASDGGPVVVTDSTFSRDVLQSPLPVLVDFWAPWCGPCRIISPIVEELGRQYAGKLRVAKVNTDENPLHAGQLGIMGIPTLIFFKNGREVDRVVGVVPKASLTSRLERVLNS